jgi:hypothetical protein
MQTECLCGTAARTAAPLCALPCQQIFVARLLFTLPMKSVLETSVSLLAQIKAKSIPRPRYAVIREVVTAKAGISGLDPGPTTSALPDMPLRPLVESELEASEACLGHTCNADQREALSRVHTGVYAIHGPPGTGTIPSRVLMAMLQQHCRPPWLHVSCLHPDIHWVFRNVCLGCGQHIAYSHHEC